MKILKLVLMTSLSFSVFAQKSSSLGPESVKAGQANDYSIDYVRIDRSGIGFVHFTTALSNTPPVCVNPSLARVLTFDTNTEGGKAIYSMLLTAQVSDKTITADGTGTCIEHTQAEAWNKGWISD